MQLLNLWIVTFLTASVTATGICKPATWTDERFPAATGTSATPTTTVRYAQLISTGDTRPGEVNCRYSAYTDSTVSKCTCAQLGAKYNVEAKKFFKLNPTLDCDCGNIKPDTEYCVAGFIEPVRAWDGRCGPNHGNATCIGTAHQCCNAETWTCGSTPEDCAPGTCFEGACPGHKIYSTDGTCGPVDNSLRLCAGKWGDCCDFNGTCGTGPDYCGADKCSFGNCVRPANFGIREPLGPWPKMGNTTDGTCGEPNKFSCNVVFGNCCNKDGVCGSDASDCGEGCQPEWGRCAPSSTKSLPTRNRSVTSESSATSTVSGGGSP